MNLNFLFVWSCAVRFKKKKNIFQYIIAAFSALLYYRLLFIRQVKAGFGVNLIGVAVVMLAITTWGVPLFNLTEFPAWAVAANVTGSL